MPLASPNENHALPQLRLRGGFTGERPSTNYFLYSVTLAPGIACPRRGGVSGPQQWLLMAPVIGDILHQSIYNLRRSM